MKLKIGSIARTIAVIARISFAKKPKGHDIAATKIVEQIAKIAKTHSVEATKMYILHKHYGWEEAFIVDAEGKSYQIAKGGTITNNVDAQIADFITACNKDDYCYLGMKINGIKVYRRHA